MINSDYNFKFLKSSSYNPWFNLGLEEYLFNTMEPNSVLMYLWQNQNTVVVGKTQNAWRECRVTQLENDGGKLARRSSGGGAVFHDLGNMCFTFISSSGLYDQNKQLKVVLDAVNQLGIKAEFTGRNDITCDGRKFSGNAFKFSKDIGLMHGTLLMDTDSEKMAKYLQVSTAKLQAKGVSSVRSRIVNLKEINSEINHDSMSEALRNSFIINYGNFEDLGVYGFDENEQNIFLNGQIINDSEILENYNKYSSWEWRLGESPSFEMSFENRFDWGCIEINITSESGIIKNAKVYTDAMDTEFAETMTEALSNIKLDSATVINAIGNSLNKSHQYICSSEQILSDLKGWLSEVL